MASFSDADAEATIRVCTLNCWGLKYVAKNRVERIAAIASVLSKSDYDIIALQELWVSADYARVRTSLHKRLPYAKYFYSGALGAGLALFSRYPIIGATVQPYSLNGSPLDVAGGDWFVGKAATSILVKHPLLGELEIFNTHLFAKGGESGPEHHRAHRLVNAWEFAKLALNSAKLGRYVICMGDYNSVPTTLPMTIIRDHAQLTDAWVASHPSLLESDSSSVALDPAEAVDRFGVTADSPLCSYSAGKPLDDHAKQFLGKRLDYILFRSPEIKEGRPKGPRLKCTQSKVVFTEKVPRREFSYSDHFGLEATFRIFRRKTSSSRTSSLDETHEPAPHEVDLTAADEDEPPLPPTYLTHASLGTVVHALTTCYRLSLVRSRKYLYFFGGAVGLLLTCIVGSAWLPRSWANPAVMLLGAVTTWFGTTMLYVGFVYGRWEVNALLNIIEELEIHRSTIPNLE